MAEMVRYGVMTNLFQPGVLIDFYGNPISGVVAGVSSFNTRTGAVVPANGDYTVSQVTGAAPLASPTFTGTPAGPTATPGTDTTQLATTAFVTSSPTFTGTPTAPTATVGTDTTQLATTAFVIANAGGGGGGIGTVLKQVVYAPSTTAIKALTTTRTAIDTVNLTTGTFTMPASGLVRVTVSAQLLNEINTTGSLQQLFLALLNHSGGGRLGADESMIVILGTASTSNFVVGGRYIYDAIVTATALSSLALDVAGYVASTSGGAAGTLLADDGLTSGNTNGPVIITVYQA